MSSHVYTLKELIDMALKTPDIGAVNFNILRIILHKIVSKCKLEAVTAEWKPYFGTIEIEEILADENLPDHPILRRIGVKKADKTPKEDDKTPREDDKTPREDDKTPKEGDKTTREDDKILRDGQETEKEKPSTEKSVQTLPAKVTDVPTQDTGVMTIDFDMVVETEEEVTSSAYKETVKKQSEKKTIDTSSKGLKVGSNLWQLWQLKKVTKRVEAVEEELSWLVEVVDDLKEFKESRMKRIKFEEGEKLGSGYSGPVIGRQEFEDTIEELGEALTRISVKQKQQKEESLAVDQDILKEVSLKVSVEDLTRSKETLNRRLKTLSTAVRSIQKLIKDVIYPEACGTTKCISCRRKAHVPIRYLIMDTKEHPKKKTDSKDLHHRIKKIQDPEAPAELKFTYASLRRALLEGGQYISSDKYQPETVEDIQIQHPERPVCPEYLASLEQFSDISNISRNFAPLRNFPDLMRRSTIYVPAIRSNEAPVKISVAAKDTDILIR